MYKIEFKIWEETCELIEKYSQKYGKYYFQLYPIKKIGSLERIKDYYYYKKMIYNSNIFTEERNFLISEEYTIKKDGTFRNKVLISPIFYIYYNAMVMQIATKYKPKRNKNISVRYAGDYKNKKLHYKQQYIEFTEELINLSYTYDTFLKLDIKDFYNNVDINRLTKLLKDSISFNEKEQIHFKEFINYIGNNGLPQIDGGIASSYLATIIYLDIIDNNYFKIIKKVLNTEDFKMVRYVDDLYIFFNKENNELKNLENRLTYEYKNLIYKQNLNLNTKKTRMCGAEYIYEEISSISLEDNETFKEELKDDFRKESLINFFEKLIEKTKEEGINYERYHSIINECFYNPEIKYFQLQIYNTIIFKDLKWFKETEIYPTFENILSENNDILIHDPKKLVSAILNMEPELLSKKILNNLYKKNENNEWTVYDSCLAMNYLLYRNFKNSKLLKCLNKYNNELFNYIQFYIETDWIKDLLDDQKYYLKLSDNSREESNIFLKYLSIIELKKGNYLTFQAYFKSYFESITLSLYSIKINKNLKLYNKKDIIEFYKEYYEIDEDDKRKISLFLDSRNENPLCHSNIKLINNKSMKTKIEKESNDILEFLKIIILKENKELQKIKKS